ncbi:MAG: DsbE family thiol:disulfide interchange protein [Rhodospirillaceae bacterium]|nr:DsbE family thiol:disulfide interchange protein [Rhodospirillaceae bacterium]MBT5040184.1 DsbE family thiol:disulfide interchange protein [Rhodospirillaceae bacterium]
MLAPAAFAVLAAVLAWQLLTGSPDKIPSALIDKSIPEFDLPPIPGWDKGLSSADIVEGGVSIVNVFASWCGPCRIEHPLLMDIAAQEILPIWGLNYKDQPADAARWLGELGDPYTQIGSDLSGRVGIDWGVYGVPETFVIDAGGRIVYKHIGVLTRIDWDEKIMPLINGLKN